MKEFDEFYNKLLEKITNEVEENILNKINIQPSIDKPLTPEDVANFLQVDKTTVYKLCKEGQLKNIKIGSIHSRKPHIRILKRDLEEWMNKSRE